MTAPVPPAAPEGVPLPYDDAALERARSMAKKHGQYVSLDGVHLARLLATIDALTARLSAAEEALAAMPHRGDVGRPESTRDPVFLLRWRPKRCDPSRDRWHVEGVWFTREEAEEFAKAHAYRWGGDQFGPCWHVYCVPADGALARLLKPVTARTALSTQRGEGGAS